MGEYDVVTGFMIEILSLFVFVFSAYLGLTRKKLNEKERQTFLSNGPRVILVLGIIGLIVLVVVFPQSFYVQSTDQDYSQLVGIIRLMTTLMWVIVLTNVVNSLPLYTVVSTVFVLLPHSFVIKWYHSDSYKLRFMIFMVMVLGFLFTKYVPYLNKKNAVIE